MKGRENETDPNADLTQEAYDEHFHTEHFAALGAAFGEEQLLAAPLDIKKVKAVGGYLSR